jgi:hypothetical protein
MLSVFARLKRCLAPAPGPAVCVFQDRFATPGIVVPWDDVSRVLAHADADGMRIEVRAAHLEDPVVLADTQPGFDAFGRMADRRLAVPLAWWEALPRARRVVLFEAALREVRRADPHPAPRSAHG